MDFTLKPAAIQNTSRYPPAVMADPTLKLLHFVREHQGIILSDWAERPNSHSNCRVVFPTKLRKPDRNGGGSAFVKEAVNFFYPSINTDLLGTHRVGVILSSTRVVQLLEGDLERRRIELPDGSKREYPSYKEAMKTASIWCFLGVNNILVQGKIGA